MEEILCFDHLKESNQFWISKPKIFFQSKDMLYSRFRSFSRFRRKRKLLLQKAFWIPFRHARNHFFLLKILLKTSRFQIFILLVNSLRARMVLLG